MLAAGPATAEAPILFNLTHAVADRQDWIAQVLSGELQRNMTPYPMKPKLPDAVVGPSANCSNLESYGRGGEEKRVCGLGQLSAPCTVISVGSNNQWQFEERVVQRTACRVVTFDCTLNASARPPAHVESRVVLIRACIGSSALHHPQNDAARRPWFLRRNYTLPPSRGVPKLPAGATIVDYASMLRLAGLTAAPAFLKMDIEGHEYSVLHSMVDEATVSEEKAMLLPAQIGIEMHAQSFGHRMSPTGVARWFVFLFVQAGYVLVDRHKRGVGCSSCSELLMASPRHHRKRAARGELISQQLALMSSAT